MTLSLINKTVGKHVLNIFTFEEVGDVLPKHIHNEDTKHLTFVSKGKFKVVGENWEKIISIGDIIVFPPNQSHEFIALEPGKIVNLIY